MTALYNAAIPIAVDRRDAFLQAVAGALRSHRGVLGDGTVYEVIREQQRVFLDPPILDRHNGARYAGK
jgi:hypothetical protein